MLHCMHVCCLMLYCSTVVFVVFAECRGLKLGWTIDEVEGIDHGCGKGLRSTLRWRWGGIVDNSSKQWRRHELMRAGRKKTVLNFLLHIKWGKIIHWTRFM